MTESTDLDRIEEAVRNASDESETLILQSVLAGEHVQTAAVPADQFPMLIRHLRPRLIYMVRTQFQAREEIEDRFDGEFDAELKKLVAKWKARDGRSSTLFIGLVADGVSHGAIETADWYDEFEAEIEGIVEARREAQSEAFIRMQEEERIRVEAEERRRLAPMIDELLADLRFNAPKTSAAKRLMLAESMFPDKDRTTLKKAIQGAVSKAWIDSQNK